MELLHPPSIDLSVVVLAPGPGPVREAAVGAVLAVLAELGVSHEMLLVDPDVGLEEAPAGGSPPEACSPPGADAGPVRRVASGGPGYGDAFRTAIRHARGRWIITIDADMAHDPRFILNLFGCRGDSEVVIGSRYMPFGFARQGFWRDVLSRLLNRVCRRALSLPLFDLSSGYRLYKRSALEAIDPVGRGHDVLVEILVRIYCEGFRVREIPLHYHPDAGRVSRASLIEVLRSYLRTLVSLWKLRNSIGSGDYDARAFDSIVWPQRYWQRERYRIIREMLDPGGRVLDIGCGSSLILVSIPGAVGLDVSMRKLRCVRGLGQHLVQAALKELPFPEGSFDQVICSQVIEHIPRENISFPEMVRVLKPGGKLILGTPDYGRIWWPMTEWIYQRVMPGGYADEHITHFTRESMCLEMEEHGVRVEAVRYILGGEMIAAGRYEPGPPPLDAREDLRSRPDAVAGR